MAAGGVEQLNWRVLAKMGAEQRGDTLNAAYTSAEDRSVGQHRLLEQATDVAAKNARRLANLAAADGVRVHTSNGVTYYRGGQGTSRGR